MLILFMLPSTIITDLGYYTRPIWDKDTNNFKLIPHYYAESVPLKTLCELHGWNEKKNKNIKIYDAVIFSVELDLLEIRIRELWDIVDTFVILESNATFTGETKKLTFSEHRQRFEFAKEKLHHVTINQHPLPAGEGPFYNENQMRRAMDSALIEAGVQEGDLIIMSDVDEIVRPQTLSILKACDGVPDVLHLQLKNYLYSFEFFLDSNSWRAHIVRYKGEQTSYTHGQISENLLSDAGEKAGTVPFVFVQLVNFSLK